MFIHVFGVMGILIRPQDFECQFLEQTGSPIPPLIVNLSCQTLK